MAANEDSVFNTSNVLDNEVIKAHDFNFAFEALIENVAKATQMMLESNQDFVINGKVLPDSGMKVKVSPIYGVCKSTGIPFGNTAVDDELEYAFDPTTNGRVDILEVKGDWDTYDNEQRAFNDPDTDTMTYQYVDTKRKMMPVYQIKKGEEGSSVAPTTDSGWVKLAEISVRANASSILESDIKNITADVAGLDNEDWTNEKDATYNIGYISDVNARFRVQHNEDGTHKENVINAVSLDIGTGANQINGNILPVGGAVSIPTQTIASVDSILSVITKIAAMITTFYNNYLKFGTYGFNGEMKLSSLLDDGALVKPISISAAGDGTAVIKIDNVAVLTITAAGQLAVSNTYNATAANHLVTKAITDALNNSISALTTRVSALENSSQNSSANKVLSSGTDGQFNVSEVALMAATTENIVLNGLSTSAVDGVTLTTDDYILVKNQSDKTENGIYYFVPNGAWGRVNEFDVPPKLKGKILKVPNGTVNKGKMFYTLNETFEDPDDFGTDQILIAEYFGSIAPVANKIIMRDAYGRAKVAAPVACDDIARKAEIDAMYGNTMPSPLGCAAVGTCCTFARSDHVHQINTTKGVDCLSTGNYGWDQLPLNTRYNFTTPVLNNNIDCRITCCAFYCYDPIQIIKHALCIDSSSLVPTDVTDGFGRYTIPGILEPSCKCSYCTSGWTTISICITDELINQWLRSCRYVIDGEIICKPNPINYLGQIFLGGCFRNPDPDDDRNTSHRNIPMVFLYGIGGIACGKAGGGTSGDRCSCVWVYNCSTRPIFFSGCGAGNLGNKSIAKFLMPGESDYARNGTCNGACFSTHYSVYIPWLPSKDGGGCDSSCWNDKQITDIQYMSLGNVLSIGSETREPW